MQVTASAWLNDLRNQIEHTRILSTVYRSASALGSRLPSMASAKAKVAGAGAMLRPVSSGTQVIKVDCSYFSMILSLGFVCFLVVIMCRVFLLASYSWVLMIPWQLLSSLELLLHAFYTIGIDGTVSYLKYEPC